MFVTISSAIVAIALQAQPSTSLRQDAGGRPVISARVNDGAPIDMVVDTAAQTSLLTPALAAELKLVPLDQEASIAGATGGTRAKLYGVDRFSTELFDARELAMVELSNAVVTSARGIIGIERFTESKLVFDRQAGRLTVAASGPAAAGYVALAGRTADGLVTVPLVLDGVTIQALVDTGAAVTVANLQTLRALGWKNDDPRLTSIGAVRGAGTGMTAARRGVIQALKLGPATLGQVPIIFSDLAPGQPDAAPAIVLGSDLLNLFEAFAVDIPRGELQIRVPRAPATK